MKVITNTPDLLIVGERPWLVAIGMIFGILTFGSVGLLVLMSGEIAGLAFLLGAALFCVAFYLFVRRVQVVLHGPDGWLEVRRQTLAGYSKVRYDLAEIDRAIVQDTRSSEGATLMRVALVIPAGESAGQHPVTQVFSSGAGATKSAEAINSWLDSYRART